MRIFVATLLLISFKASANTIVVSDIDDTIRQTNVRELHKFTVLKQLEFAGLSKLFGHLKKSVSRIEYVSGVPEQARMISEFFILWNLFPEGRLFARDLQYDTVTHKSKAIDQIVLENSPTRILMFGDIGEKDHLIYKKAAEKYSNIITDVYIHQLYDTEIPDEQTRWLTSIDLTVALYAQGHVSAAALDDVLKYAAKKLGGSRQSREEFFPSWAQCQMFFKNYSRPDVRLEQSHELIVQAYERFLQQRCS